MNSAGAAGAAAVGSGAPTSPPPLREAAACARLLGRPEADRWLAMAGDVFLARDPRTGAILNQDPASHPEDEANAATPEALAGMVFPFDFQVPPDVERAPLRQQLDAVGPYVGRPMLSPLLGLYAARLGDRALSARLFEQGYAELVEGPWLTANEFSPVRFPDKPKVGPLFANLGGFLSACAVGLSGLRISHEDPCRWPQRPVVMPEGWDGVVVDRLWLHGRPARLTARHGDERAVIEYLDDGAP